MENRTKKIQAVKVAGDIRNGMDDSALMLKYDLSPKQLRSLMHKLGEAGLLERERPLGGVPSGDESDGRVFSCPSCGVSQPDRFDECPLCGVVLSKLVEGQKETRSELSAGVSGYGASLGGGTSELMSTKYGTRVFSIIAIFAIGIAGVFAYRWLGQSRSEQALVRNVRPLLEYLVDGVADDFDWEGAAEKFQSAVNSSRGPFKGGRPDLHANLDLIQSHMVRIAKLKKDIAEIMPDARSEARGRLQPQIDNEIALFLEDRVARIRDEVVPKLVADRWNEFADALKNGSVKGNPKALRHFKRPQVLERLRQDFERQMNGQIERRLQWAEERIRNREFLATPSPGPEPFTMSFPSRWGKLQVHAEVDVLANVFNKEELEGKVNDRLENGVETAIASEETHGLEATSELESRRNQLEHEKEALVVACQKALEHMNRQD
jgi:hypothetical protein